ncbi:MAG: hypothetical protein LBG68_03215, partial [Coriobacteriales bacterium]|nr:hypothetical protein [Coriobacteriales bacterium]
MRIVVGQGSCGIASGAKKTAAEFQRLLEAGGYQNVSLSKVGCIGNCYLEPIVDVYDDDDKLEARYVLVTEDKVAQIVESHIAQGQLVEELLISPSDEDFLNDQQRIVLRDIGLIDPEDIQQYIARGGYAALQKVLQSMSPDEVIEELKTAGLRGRGGAGFPTWFKWNAAKASPGDVKYIVCNADEGDPGAFMDRSVLEGDPHAVLEGIIIGGYTIGATEGIIYVRAEYPLAVQRLQIAIAQAEEAGWLGQDICGSGFNFSIRIKAGAGAFVCGEETALIASLEGERGMPRLRPPYPAEKGFWQKPTN